MSRNQATCNSVKDQVLGPCEHRGWDVAAVGVMCAQQLCGINSIIMYSVSLLRDLLPISSALLTIMILAINLITTVAHKGAIPHAEELIVKSISDLGQVAVMHAYLPHAAARN